MAKRKRKSQAGRKSKAKPKRRASRSKGGARRFDWASLPEEELLGLRLSDLKLRIEGTVLDRRIEQVYRELQAKGITFRPHFWLSGEWFTPDGVPGAAIPFYLAHPRLKRLEEKMMLEAEGGTRRWCMQLLRHETGHALCNAYRLNRRRAWQRTFGRSSAPYPDYYRPKPYSKRFVLHLDYWYAQSHPAEDFAETFAVWLTPRSGWRRRYADWPALEKLEYVDEVMKEVAGRRPPVRTRERTAPLNRTRLTLRTYYRRKRERYGTEYPGFYDRDLRRLFAGGDAAPDGEPAARFLRRVGPDLRRRVARWTGEYQYTIDQVLKEMTGRCRELGLRTCRDEEEAKLEMAILLSVQTMNYLHSGYHRVAL
jgi:hypothetical protein